MSRYRILSLDGGGIRGLLPACFLERLEQRLQQHGTDLRGSFDLIAGTSTGAIIAAGLAAGRSAKEIADLYRLRGKEIFSKRWLHKLRWLTSPAYAADGLERVLKDSLGENAPLKEAKPRLLLTAFNAKSRVLVPFDSSNSQLNSIPLWRACRASAAAPTYFPAYGIDAIGKSFPLLDGGVAANNPAALALGIAMSEGHRPEDVMLVSLGTGASSSCLEQSQGARWGIWKWKDHIVDVMFDGSADSNKLLIEQVLGSRRYHRFQPTLKSPPKLDDGSSAYLEELEEDMTKYLDGDVGRRELKDLVSALTGNPACDLRGKWRTTTTWEGGEKPVKDIIEVECRGDSFWGKAVEGIWPYTFRGRVEDGHRLVGEHDNPQSGLHGTFLLETTGDAPGGKWDEAAGYWIGTNGSGLCQGTWDWGRLKE